jgi:hypothetical protein
VSSGTALLVPSGTSAHHSFAAFEEVRVRTLEGTITRFTWGNPHVTVSMVAQADGRGDGEPWMIVTSGPAILKRFGWQRDSLHDGDRVSVVCNPRRDGSHECRLHTLTLRETGVVLRTKLSDSVDPRP